MFRRVNIAITPPAEIQEYVLSLSKDIGEKEEGFFVLDGINFFPHITLYSPEYPEENIEKVLSIAEEISKFIRPFTLISKSINTHEGYIDIEIEKSPQLQELHEEMVTKLNPIRKIILGRSIKMRKC